MKMMLRAKICNRTTLTIKKLMNNVMKATKGSFQTTLNHAQHRTQHRFLFDDDEIQVRIESEYSGFEVGAARGALLSSLLFIQQLYNRHASVRRPK